MSEAIDILKREDINAGISVNYKETTTWYDGTAMSDIKCDGVVYRKKGSKYYVLQYTQGIPIELFGAKGDGVTDDTAAFLAARNYAVRTSQDIGLTNFSVEITFKGKYLITQSPNWAIRNLRLTGIGQAEIICTGSGPVMDLWYYSATHPRTVSGMKISNLLLTGNSTTSSCFAARAISQSVFDNIICRNANNTTGTGFRLCANVCNVFIKPTVSINYNEGMVSIPKYGIYFEHDDGPSIIGNTTACQFNMIVMEGVDIGMFAEDISFDVNTFNEGTSEGNTTGGLYIGANNRGNTFKNIAFEKNTSYDIDDHGVNTIIEGGYSTNNINFVNTRFCKIQNIRAQTINIDANCVNTKVADLSINNWQGAGYPTGGIFNNSTTTDIVRIRDWGTSDNMYAGYHDRFKYRLATSSGNIVGDTQNEVIEVNATSADLTMTITTSTINAPNTIKIIKNNGTFNVIVTAGAGTVLAPATSITVRPFQTIKIISTNNTNTWRLVETTYAGWQQVSNGDGTNRLEPVITANNIAIGGTPSDSSYKLSVMGGNMKLDFAQDGVSSFDISNTNSGTNAVAGIKLYNSSGNIATLSVGGNGNSTFPNKTYLSASGTGLILAAVGATANIDFATNTAGTTPTNIATTNSKMRIFANGNVAIGSNVSDTSYKFSVVGGGSLFQNNNNNAFNTVFQNNSTGTSSSVRFDVQTDFGSFFKMIAGGTNNASYPNRTYLSSTGNGILIGAVGTTATIDFSINSGGSTDPGSIGTVNSLMRIFAGGNVAIAADATNDGVNKLQVNGSIRATQFRLSTLNTAPTSATDTGVLGEVRIDASYIYVCTATNTWKRSAITTW